MNLEINIGWDGLFNAFTWFMTAFGTGLLFRAARRPEVPLMGRTFVGSFGMGWGIFNVVEVVIDHHLLHLHHVVERAGGVSVWYWAFLATGVAFITIGLYLIRADAGVGHPTRPQRPS